jgi:OmpA-OmpF porin, OOP family
LPNGQKLDLAEGTFNYKFAKYLTDSSAKVNQTFTFDNLNFESNSPVLVAGSEKTVQDLAKIMAAYPRVQVKLTGYTDNTGDSLQNRKLSAKRAFTVRNLLVANGISDIRIDFAGKGASNPVASNATEAGKAQNRRIEVKVVKK